MLIRRTSIVIIYVNATQKLCYLYEVNVFLVEMNNEHSNERHLSLAIKAFV